MLAIYGINIDLTRDNRLSEQALKLLKDFYLEKGETSPQEAFARAAVAYCDGDLELAQRIYDYVSKGWFMYSSPVLSNAPIPGEDFRGLPISCFLSYVPDTVEGLIGHHAETAWLSVKGGGVGGHWSNVRGITEKSAGVIPMMKVSDAQMTSYKQGKTRKGSYAAYLDVSHPDIVEFINFKVPTGGDVNRKCFNLFNAVNLSDEFMEAAKAGQDWDLICPDKNVVIDTVKARDLWERILDARFRTGSPYMNFIDTANRALPEYQKELGLKIHGSNLCNEIHLATNDDRTAVCCLSSVNIEAYDDWKDSTIIEDLVTFLDNVLDVFIANAPDDMHKAKYSAERERSIGIGAMGFHGYLMKENIAWESEAASSINRSIFGDMNEKATKQTKFLGRVKGIAPDAKGYGVRNAHLFAIAPNANSSILCNCTASIEPLKANVYVHRTRAGADVIKNQYLGPVLDTYGMNNEDVWSSIMDNDGSVQHLEFLSDHDKAVFKTSFELDQMWVVEHSAQRQKFICQGQSVNLFFPSGTEKSYVNKVHLKAWSDGLKGLYYLRTTAGRTGDKVGQSVVRDALATEKSNIIYGRPDCPYCEQAKMLLKIKGIEFEYIDLAEIGKTAAQVTGRKDVRTVPQIYIGGEYVGGFTELQKHFKKPITNEDDDDCLNCQG
ncbi:ribonucleoside-diphosphate reductase subunit alpha [Akkermansiaceae bacterium]|nr:ribonucleoside-diphosphate reductase subunit alpha [Akkermansiaceae bacterium]